MVSATEILVMSSDSQTNAMGNNIFAGEQEEAKFEKQVNAAQQQLDKVRAAIKLLGRYE